MKRRKSPWGVRHLKNPSPTYGVYRKARRANRTDASRKELKHYRRYLRRESEADAAAERRSAAAWGKLSDKRRKAMRRRAA